MKKICNINNREKMNKRFSRNFKAFNLALIFTVAVSLLLVSFAPALSNTYNSIDNENTGILLMKVVVGSAYKCNSDPASGGSIIISSSLGSRSGTVLGDGNFQVDISGSGPGDPDWPAGTSISVSVSLTDGDGSFSGSKSGTVSSGTVTDVGTVTLDPTTLVASGSGLPLSGDAPLSVDFTGSATGGCKPYTWYWDFDGDGSSSLQSPTHVFNTPGTYNCILTVTDDCSNTDDSPTVTITVENTAPPTPSTPTGTTSGMHGTSYSYNTGAVVDPEGDTVEYRFDWDDGSMSSWSTSTSASHTWTTVGTFDVKVQARDEHDAMSGWSSALSVDMGNTAPPTPSTPTGTTSGMHGTSYSYNTVAVVDPEGDTVEYRFDWDDGSMSSWSTSTSASHTWTTVGTFDVKVQASDDWDESGWSSALSVDMGNTAPDTPTTPSGPSSGYAGETYSYSTSSTDPEDDTIQYFFDWGDSQNSGWISSASRSHSWSVDGTYNVKVKARDTFLDESGWSPDKTVEISQASLKADCHGPYQGYIGENIRMVGSATGGTLPYTYDWDFGDGTSSSLEAPQHKYSLVGIYYVTLTVTDNDAYTDIDHTTCTIYSEDTPIVEANGPYEGEVGETVEFDGDVTGGTAPYDYYWEFGDGMISYEQNPEHIYENTGEYIANFSVVDDLGMESNIDNATVTIITANNPPDKPGTPTGPASGKAGEQYTYQCMGTDPDNDQLYYWFDWGDGENSGWIGPINHLDMASASHTWEDKDDYEIKVKTKDPRGEESIWSDPLPIKMPKSNAKLIFSEILEKLIERYEILEWLFSLPIFNPA
ncbi:PKD domain-containing protein [Thermoplasmatota archaeon]